MLVLIYEKFEKIILKCLFRFIFQKAFKTNYYLRSDLSQLEKGMKSMYGFPKVFPHNPKMCLSFIYLLNGTGLSEIKVGLLQEINNFTSLFFMWKESIKYSINLLLL